MKKPGAEPRPALPAAWSRVLGADRANRLRDVGQRTGLSPEALMDVALDLLELVHAGLFPSPIHRTAVALGAARWRNVSPAARSEALRRAALARWAKRPSPVALPAARREDGAREES